jgi:hypothetical protein
MSDPLTYKVVETSIVTDEAIEAIINEWVRLGWSFDGIQFAMRESSKRPGMAFVLFTRAAPFAVATEESPPPIDSDES